jgi:hypothetical protein
MFPEVVLQGRLVRLRPVTEPDLPFFLHWLNDPNITQWLAMPESGPPAALEAEHAWYERTKQDPNQLVWSIETHGGHLLGNLALHRGIRVDAAERGAKGMGPTRCGRLSGMPLARWAYGASTSILTWRTSGRTAALRSAGSGRKGS